MVTIRIEEDELAKIYSLAKQRHNAKDKSFRDTGILIPNPKSVYAPHTIGLLGEFAWGKHTHQLVDSAIYEVRDEGEDFKDTEVKTLTYFGKGDPELKIKKQEFLSKHPSLYVLTRVDKKNLTKVELLGTISREDFAKKKREKRYSSNNPLNYVVSLADMNAVEQQVPFLQRFHPYDDCVPPGVLLPVIEIEDKYYKELNLDNNTSNFEFLRKLCHQGAEEKKIKKFTMIEPRWSLISLTIWVSLIMFCLTGTFLIIATRMIFQRVQVGAQQLGHWFSFLLGSRR